MTQQPGLARLFCFEPEQALPGLASECEARHGFA